METRPAATEYAEYYQKYIGLVPDGDIVGRLRQQVEATLALLRRVPADRELYRYAPGKWSIREVVGHVVDTERVMSLRALWFARSAPGVLPSMEQDDWAAASNAEATPLSALVEDFRSVRAATVSLFAGLDAEAMSRAGVASGVTFTARSIAWILAGHELHHVAGLRRDYGIE